MLHCSKYRSHEKELYTKRGIIYDDTIYTFDIETTTVILYDHKIYDQDFYDTLSEKEKKHAHVYGFMYIWQLSINDIVYYGRTWADFKNFFVKVFNDTNINYTIYVHNLSMECQFLRSIMKIDKVFARQKYKPIYFDTKNIQFRCSFYLTQAKLEGLHGLYNLPVVKKAGDLDYKKIRHYDTILTQKELNYCKYDCLVVYELIKQFKAEYKHILDIPLTKTGILRRVCKKEMRKAPAFTLKMKDLINNDRNLFNAQVRSFSGGYTHTNCFYSGMIIENIDNYDFCSSYSFIMCCEPVFPQTAFKKFTHTKLENLQEKFIYLIHLKITNLRSIKQNTILSMNKCFNISKDHILDNGRFITCASCECWMTNFDYEMLKKFYEFDTEMLELYGAPAGYMPKDYIRFVLDIYKKKTTLKNVPGKEQEYSRAKNDFNSLYGMCVTNTIRPEVVFESGDWSIQDLTNDQIDSKLEEESKKLFLHFSYGIFITSKARYNLLSIVEKLDSYNIYSDTDSCKLRPGYNKHVIHEYNINVIKKIKKAKEYLKLSGFTQKDIKGNSHTLGIFEQEKSYKKFIAIGAKKYAYTDKDDHIHITVAGVPKEGSKCLKSLEEFRDDFIFESKVTGKLQLFYNEEKNINLTVTDYKGKTRDINFSYGIGFVPCTYTLKKSSFYTEFDDMFIQRSLYK